MPARNNDSLTAVVLVRQGAFVPRDQSRSAPHCFHCFHTAAPSLGSAFFRSRCAADAVIMDFKGMSMGQVNQDFLW